MVYPALLPLMRTPSTEVTSPADLNALARFAETTKSVKDMWDIGLKKKRSQFIKMKPGLNFGNIQCGN